MTDRVVRVLVVDDDRAIRETLKAALQDEGYSVAEASNGAQALSLLRDAHDSYVVLLDLRMPVMGGAKLLETVAADDRLVARHAYTIITANPDVVPAAQAATHGRFSVPVILKPFDLDDVLEHVAHTAASLMGNHGAGPEAGPEATL